MPEGIANVTPESLAGFYGSENYYRFMNLIITDGVHFLAQNNCHWLIVAISSHQTKKVREASGGFQSWKLVPMDREKTGKMAVLVCDDGNGKVLVRQEIELTDFPFNRFPEGFNLYVEEGSLDGKTTNWICMLPGER